METKTKKRFRFNFIDVILIFVILAALACLFYLFTSHQTENSGSTGKYDVVYTIEVRTIRDEFKNLVNVGDKVVDAVQLFTIGEVTDVSYKNSDYTTFDRENGTLVHYDYPGFLDMTLTVRASANLENNTYMIGGYELAVGVLVSFRTPSYTASGYCTTITATEQ